MTAGSSVGNIRPNGCKFTSIGIDDSIPTLRARTQLKQEVSKQNTSGNADKDGSKDTIEGRGFETSPNGKLKFFCGSVGVPVLMPEGVLVFLKLGK